MHPRFYRTVFTGFCATATQILPRIRFAILVALIGSLILHDSENRPAAAQGAPNLVWARGQGLVTTFSASADGSLLAEYGAGVYKVVRIIRTSDFHQLHAYPIPTGTGTDLQGFAMSPDGRYFAVENSDALSFSLYRVSDGSVVWTAQDNMGGPGRWGFTSDSSKLIYSSSDQDTARKNYRVTIRNVSDGSVVSSVYGWLGWQCGVSQGSDEMVLSYLSSSGWRVDFYSASTGAFVETWSRGDLTVLGLSADGQYVIAEVGSFLLGDPIYAYRRSDGSLAATLALGSDSPVALAVSGSHVSIGSGNSTENVLWDYDIPTGAGGRVDRYPPDGLIRDVARLADGICLVAISEGQGGQVDAYKDGQHLFHDHGMTSGSMGLRVSPDGARIVTADAYNLYLWNTESGDLLARVYLYSQGLQYASPQEGLLWSPDGILLFMQTYNPISRTYNHELRSAADLSLIRAWEGPGRYTSAAFTADSRQVITTYGSRSGGYSSSRWDVATGADLADYTGYGAGVATSPVGGYVAFQESNYLSIYTSDLLTQITYSPHLDLGGDPNITFSPDGSTIALGFRSDWYSYVFGFDGTSLTQLARFPYTNVQSLWEPLAIDPTNSYVLRSYSLDNLSPALLALTPIGAGSERIFDQEIGFGRADATNVAFTPDGKRIVYTLADGTVAVAQNPLSDQFPPSTVATISPTPNAAGWNNSETTVHFVATDNIGGSGVKSITYQIQGFNSDTVAGDNAGVSTTAQGVRTVTFQSQDNAGNTEPQHSITLKIDTDSPSADAQNVSLNQDTSTAITLNGSDSLSGVATYSVVSTPSNGTLSGTAQNLSYTPNPGYYGPDTFTFKTTDAAGNDSPPATVSITVNRTNHAPVANAQTVVTPFNTPVNIALTASDSDGDALTYSVVTQPLHGALSGTGANLTYTPAAGYSGPDNFTFKANDGTLDSNTTTVSITVNLPAVPVPTSVTFNPPSVTGGSNSTGTVTMSAAVAAATVVNLSSNNAATAVPVSVTIPANATSATFTAKTQAVATDTTTVVTASTSGGQATGSLTIAAPVVTAIKLKVTSIQGPGAFTGNTVALSGPAPAGGLNVILTSSGPASPTISNLLVPAGSSSGSFAVQTTNVAADTVATITASLNGSSKTASLSVTAATLNLLEFLPTNLKPGQQTVLTVVLNGYSGGQAVSLSSSDSGIIAVPSSVVVPFGQTGVNVTITAGPVTKKTNVTITGTLFGVNKKAAVTVSP